MSGGHYNAQDLIDNLFDWNLGFTHYSYLLDKGDEQAKWYRRRARDINPFEDREVSELFADLMVVIHALDYYTCADIGEDTYLKVKKAFKEKWMQRDENARKDALLDDLNAAYNRLITEIEKG